MLLARYKLIFSSLRQYSMIPIHSVGLILQMNRSGLITVLLLFYYCLIGDLLAAGYCKTHLKIGEFN